MSENQRKIAINLYDEYIELTIGNSVFRLSLDERGLPQFPESVKESLPPYIPELVERLLRLGEYDESHIHIVDHKTWCPEVRRTGKCNCNPVISATLRDNTGPLTCNACGEFSIGEIRTSVTEDTCGKRWLLHRTETGDMLYWTFPEDESGQILCHNCLKRIMAEVGVEVPDNIFDVEDDSSSGSLH
jgi:hypothetical protein